MDVERASSYILGELGSRLPADLFYHGLHHTLDVVRAAMELAAEEGVTDEEALLLLRTAALYHDAGFMVVYREHEAEGCRIAQEVLPAFGYSSRQADAICGMIMATKIPQSPATHLEQILCDADLDYLGRDDFETIGATLFEELRARGLAGNPDEWNRTQVHFLTAHQYWTAAARRKRAPRKAAHLAGLKNRPGY
ncbi:HD domain-containing protein [Dyadobacter sandarakinus]|uniref:HD domain-containing protein n=2 Tax=Dyadobacter sandarakinus TaxID=2747268 RepID=A0ABX7ID49_9BACT|nr:HD domain-containing protein [Dyadobacter sandarakinus]